MTLRARLFLLIGTLVVVLVTAQWWFMRALSTELGEEVDSVALTVGQGVMREIGHILPKAAPGSTVSVTSEIHTGTDGQVTSTVRSSSGESKLQSGAPRVIVLSSEEQTSAGSSPPQKKILYEYHVVLSGTPREGDHHELVLQGPHQARVVPIPKSRIEQRVTSFSRKLIGGTLGLLSFGLLMSALIAHKVTAPLRNLRRAAQQLERGELGVQATGASASEVGETVQAFNRMSKQLQHLEGEARKLQDERHLGELSEVARGLAHALRNPLNTVGLAVEELGRRATDTGSEELVATARSEISRIDSSLRSFLALSSTGREAATASVSMIALCRDVVLEALQNSRGRVSIELDESPGDDPTIRAVSTEVRAAIQAVILNAVEATNDGGSVRVSLESDEGTVRVRVEDEGAGLPANVRAKLFQPHVTTKANGCGMGLYLAERIVSGRYGGRVTIADRSPRGTRAVIELPREQGA
ncbi:MAG: HAMP domain-containing histidine kinase [Acidobacteria bacterium]|nr:HAMP domain-containing histidine kinase [Acidobacteriota bacterium]